MSTAIAPNATSITRPSARRVGVALSGIAIAFLAVDTAVKLAGAAPAIEATTQLGYAGSAVLTIGIIEAVCVALYAIPRTALLGALLLTGYFGGAIASQYRAGNPLASHTLFPLYVAALVWGGVWLRDARVRAIVRSR